MRNFNLPASHSLEQADTAESADSLRPPEPNHRPPDHRPPDHPPPPVPAAGRAEAPAWKALATAFGLLARLRAGFARSEAVHQARLDDFWRLERHLLMHHACSVR